MLAEIGHLALIVAFVSTMALIYVAAMRAFTYKDKHYDALVSLALHGQFLSLSVAMVILAWLFLGDDFSVAVVYRNSHTHQPPIYKLTALWGNHEGSLLLWVWVLAVFSQIYAYAARHAAPQFNAKTLMVQGFVSAAFLALSLYSSSPFARILPYPPQGQSLNPLLQDPGLVMHPPLLYMGYVGLSVNFSLAIAVLIQGEFSVMALALMRRFALLAWCFLGAGIALGSWWAYYELGWGGFWFWDPVENASFIPWLITTALIHCLIVTERRGALKQWSLLLSLTAFSLTLMGTFLVRSGILTSVHAFANDARRGLFILMLLAVTLLGAFILFAWRAPRFKDNRDGGLFFPVSREGGLILNNFLLTAAAGVVFIGTLFPLFLQLVGGDRVTVGAPYFNISFVPLMMAALALMAVVPLLSWRRARLKKIALRLGAVGGGAALFAFALAGYYDNGGAAFIFGFALWLMGAAMVALYRHYVKSRGAVPLRVLGMVVAHFAMGLGLCGIAGVSLLSEDEIYLMRSGDTIRFRDYDVRLESIKRFEKSNYAALQGELYFIGEHTSFILRPERRRYVGGRETTTEAAIRTTFGGDFYATLSLRAAASDARADEFIVHVRYKPLALFLWVAASLMVMGGLLSLCGRRSLRILSETRG